MMESLTRMATSLSLHTTQLWLGMTQTRIPKACPQRQTISLACVELMRFKMSQVCITFLALHYMFTQSDVHDMTEHSSRKTQQELGGSRTHAERDSCAPVSRPNLHRTNSRASSHMPASHPNLGPDSRASSHILGSRPNLHVNSRAGSHALGSHASNSNANPPALGSRASSIADFEDVELPKQQTVGKREKNRLAKQQREVVINIIITTSFLTWLSDSNVGCWWLGRSFA